MQGQILIFPGVPPTKKNRQRIGLMRNTGRPLIYKPKSVKEYEAMVAQEIMVQKGKRVEGPFSLSLSVVYNPSKEPDLDGTLTTIVDCLQDGGLFENDKQLVRIRESIKRPVKGEEKPHVVVEISKI